MKKKLIKYVLLTPPPLKSDKNYFDWEWSGIFRNVLEQKGCLKISLYAKFGTCINHQLQLDWIHKDPELLLLLLLLLLLYIILES